ncbi:MAG TPA: 2-oxoacid:acceptor oxidoreductase subunit alpha [Phycisphaerae bacterium]|nr:2-oxoacid:acceptor oxidoreductase subunit alpha [Phycisphaerales bacterium]HRX83534.1 2-oxoacid:acceptor oxidoreductase subunit alpha [Phycisphaerae bacterium]
MTSTTTAPPARSASRQIAESVTVRFCGDSGDGMQLAGTQFTNTSSIFGNDVATLPDFPAEIRAPAGSIPGVSGFQINFSSRDIHTPGDEVDALIAMNPAALVSNFKDVRPGGLVVVNEDAFKQSNFDKAHLATNPLDDDTLQGFRVYRVPMEKLTAEAAGAFGLTTKAVNRCKNFFALGIVCWLYERPLEPIERWIGQKMGKNPAIADANTAALKAGWNYCDTVELFPHAYRVPKASIPPGVYRKITGNEATAMGLATAARLAGKQLFYGSYPITPASTILEELAALMHLGVKTFQAEDEIAAIASAIGAAFAGSVAATGTSGPGLALKSEAVGLAVMTELPLVIVNVQRGGPSTGLPTKTEQADYFQALYGRNGECPVAVLAASTPADCFTLAMEATRLAVEYMTPVILLTDGYLANGSEPWSVPKIADLPRIKIEHPTSLNGDAHFMPYRRNKIGGRPWAIPGTEGLQHRIGGLEKQSVTGNVNYDPENHHEMIRQRQEKIERIAERIPEQTVEGVADADLLVASWGSTYGAITTAVERLVAQGKRVAHMHLRYLNPMPRNTGEIVRRYKRVIVPEMNMGQLLFKLRADYLVDAKGVNKVKGRPFLVSEIEAAINTALEELAS